MKNEIHVKISEVKTGRAGDRLKATLGSCVGIAFLWKEKGLFGLAHCLLPFSEGAQTDLGAKYVPQAIDSLVKIMKLEHIDAKKIEVIIAGGGNMLAQLSCHNSNNIGDQNIEAARKFLKSAGFFISHESVGGNEGRQIFIDCDSGIVEIQKIQSSI